MCAYATLPSPFFSVDLIEFIFVCGTQIVPYLTLQSAPRRVVNAIKKWIELNIADWDRAELEQKFTAGIARMRGEGGHADQWANHLTDALVRHLLLSLAVSHRPSRHLPRWAPLRI